MSSRLFHRLTVSALAVAVLLALAVAPAQAATARSTVLDNLGAKVQSWLAAWLPGAGLHLEGTTDTNGGGQARADAKLRSGRPSGEKSVHRFIRPECNPVTDPNGCPH